MIFGGGGICPVAHILVAGLPGAHTLGVQCTPDQTDSVVTLYRSCNQVKIRIENNCRHLIDFLSQIIKISYFMLDLAVFLMHH